MLEASLTTSDVGGGQEGGVPSGCGQIGVCCVITPMHTIPVCCRRPSLHPSDLAGNTVHARFC